MAPSIGKLLAKVSGAAMGCCVAVGLAGDPPEAPVRVEATVVHEVSGAAGVGGAAVATGTGDGDVVVWVGHGEADPAGKAFIGVRLEPVSPALRKHLKLDEHRGVLVQDILPDSPAAKAGLEKDDIILSSGEKGIGSAADLAAVLEAAGGKEVALSVVRAGERVEVKVTPAERPQGLEHGLETDVLELTGPDGKRVHLEGDPLRLHVVSPGVVVHSAAHVLPEGVTVNVTKEGGKPARIVVRKGDKSWETTEDKLDLLPAEVRKHVRGIIAPPPLGTGLFGAQAAPVVKVLRSGGDGEVFELQLESAPHAEGKAVVVRPPQLKALKAATAKKVAPEADRIREIERRMEKRFDALERKIESLQKAIEKAGRGGPV